MDFNQQKEQLINYFKRGETKQQKIGVEVEHFVIDKSTLRAVIYQENRGIEDLLYKLSGRNNWQQEIEGGHLIGLNSTTANITLEPGGQLEIGITPCSGLKGLEQIYDSFLQDIMPILERENYLLTTLGYQIKSQIKEIPFNPKQRYKIMAQYLKETGNYAHHMMKGTASLQIALDYKDEADFIKKFQVASFLSPVLASLLDNAPVFEGEIYDREALRTLIWENTDPSRTGIVDCFGTDFSYRKYAEYVLTREPILLKTSGQYIATENKTCRELFADNKLGIEELEHILTMVFPDVRAKQFIEIRMIDSLPPDLMMSVIAFWKGLMYNQVSLDKAYKFCEQFKVEEIIKARRKIIQRGVKAKLGTENMLTIAQQMFKWAKQGLTQQEEGYLAPLKKLLSTEQTPAQSLKRRLKRYQRTEAIKNCVVNNYWKGDKE